MGASRCNKPGHSPRAPTCNRRVPKIRLILEDLTSGFTGKAFLPHDIQILVARIKREQQAGTTTEERLANLFREFDLADAGNSSRVNVNPQMGEVESAMFQSAGQKRILAAFPEVVMIDCTHSTNRNKYLLFSFVVHDVFGKGQYVHHSLIRRETRDNMEDVIVEFKKNNPKWKDIRVFIIDKDFRERSLLKQHFEDADVLLCHYHVIKVFAKMVKALVSGTKDQKDDLIHILRAVM